VVAAVAVLAAAPEAHATIVERVVAVIGERPVLWTDLLHRAAAGRVQIRASLREMKIRDSQGRDDKIDPNLVSAQEQGMYKELLDKMIDERLEENQADRAHISVSPEEIDRGIANIAAQAQAQQGRPVVVQDVIAEVHRRGMTEQDFRDEIRRQILEGKLLELRVRPRVRVTEQDARATYQHWVQELRDEQPVEVRILALRVTPGATPEQINARMVLAEELARQARSGTDFCRLVAQYSDDVSNRGTCGSRGPQPFASLLAPVQEAVHSLKPGTVSDPIPVQIGPEQVIILVMPMGEAHAPAFDGVKNEMMQRALVEGLERARKQWLQDLRHNVYIDVRL